MKAIQVLQELLDKKLLEEGITPAILECTDLDVAYSPVIAFQGEGAVNVIGRTRGGGYIVDHPLLKHPVDKEDLRVMRARYIVAVKGLATPAAEAGTGEQEE